MAATYARLFLIIISLGLAKCAGHHRKSSDKITCSAPFQPIGESCVLVDDNMLGSWNDVRNFCKDRGGESVNIFDANLLHDIVLYLNESNVFNVGFWIGAYDLFSEGNWVWSLNNSAVQMNTPLWGVSGNKQEPQGGTAENCAFLNHQYYFYVFDDDCNEFHAALCSAPPTVTHKDTQETRKVRVPDCPAPFVPLGGSCLMVSAIQGSRWDNQMILCQDLGGQLAQIEDANDFAALYEYLDGNTVTMDLWIGGTDLGNEGFWTWSDGSSPVPMLTPFWGESEVTAGTQEPSGGTEQNCLALSSDDFFFFHDYNCDEEKGVVCQYIV